MTTYIGTATPASTAAPRSPARRNMPASSTCPASPMRSVVDIDHRQRPHRAHRHQRGACASTACIDVLTHENRPPHGRHRQRLQGRCGAREGSPFRPLYDDKIMFSGQPIALVLAEDWETARFAASLVRVEYEAGSARHRPDAQRDEAFVVDKAATKPRGDADEGLRGGRRAPRGRIFRSDRASQPDGTVCLDRDRGTATAS